MARRPAQFKMSREQQKLAADNLNLARREAWRLQRTTSIDYQTLESGAFEGLCKAAYRYDPERPHPVTGKAMKFSSLAVPTIRGELMHWIRDRTYSVRLSHKMRELWVKGRKLLYRGSTDLEIAKALEITTEEWIEVRKVCSGPPLELKEQANPSEPLEPSEFDFAAMYLKLADDAINELSLEHKDELLKIRLYLSESGRVIPREAINKILDSAGCQQTDWSLAIEDEQDEWEDLGNGRMQGMLF